MWAERSGHYREREYFGGSQGPTRGEFSGDVICLTVTGKSATSMSW